MKLFYSPPSPYSSKVRMAARHLDLPLQEIATDTGSKPRDLLAANPLGKIPTLVLEDGTALFDSRVIMSELDRLAPGTLYPADPAAGREARRLEAVGDGLCDAMLAIVYDKRMRPEEKWHRPWQDAQWDKVVRTLDWLDGSAPSGGGPLDAGRFALAAALGYADLRFPDRNWRDGRPALAGFLERFAAECPGWEDARPQ